MDTYNKFSQYVPTAKEVVDYFIQFGSTQEQALFWFNFMDRKEWKASDGKPIREWSKIAYLRIQDIKSGNRVPFVSDEVKESRKEKAKDKGCKIISEGLATLYQQQTGILPSIYKECIYKLLLSLKEKHSFDDIQLYQFVESNLEDNSDWEYTNVESILRSVL